MKLLCLLFSCMLCSRLNAQTTFEANGLVYKEVLSQKEKLCVTVERKVIDDPSGYPVQSYYSGEIIVPTQVEFDLDKYEVTGISKWAFWICEGMTSLTIENGIKRLYPYTIWGKDLTTLKLPDSLEQIDNYAINSSPGVLKYVSFGIGLKTFGDENLKWEPIEEVKFAQEKPLFDCPAFLKSNENIIVNVPKGSIVKYETAWGRLNYKEFE